MTVTDTFFSPPADCRPTPLFWWTGADLDRDRLAVQLDELAAKGIGGTIVGYSHLPDGDLDHGEPAPLTEDWWDLFRWFNEASAERGMTVGLQDYGLNGPLLRAAGRHTADLGSGTLVHLQQSCTGPGEFRTRADGSTLVTAAALDAQGVPTTLTVVEQEGELHYALPAGDWVVSLVLSRPTFIGHHPSSFDPLHPESGQRLIEVFYQRLADQLGPWFGSTFTTIFQDELDFGLRMPMWNDLVADRLADRGFDHRAWLPGLWLDLGELTLEFRAAYRDVVVRLLEDHYFRPIFDWHQRHGTSMLIDQVSRGDLRLGRRAYGDYLQTMRWYNGPGNDDPDLTTPRSVAAFKVSASLARLNDRPYVANEAFHSSGWGIEPRTILAGLNAGFGYGVNHVIMHGLDYTSEGGWWEWASPDFHFRQPWWQHSRPLWDYVTRTCAMLRWGVGVAEVAVLDPTQDLDLTGDTATSPELAVAILAALAEAGHDCDLLDRQHLVEAEVVDAQLRVGRCAYRGLVIPDLRALRSDSLRAVLRFAAAGGLVVALGEPPTSTELGPVPAEVWASVTRMDLGSSEELATQLSALISARWEPDFDARGTGLVAAHRRSAGSDLYFITNVTDSRVAGGVDVRARGRVDTFDAWTGTVTPGAATLSPVKTHSTRLELTLPAGSATVVVVDTTAPPVSVSPPAPHGTTTLLTGPWQVEVVPVLDNSYGDFEYGGRPMGVETWHVETSEAASGPWNAAVVRDGTTFLVLGPVAEDRVTSVERRLAGATPRVGGTVPEAGDGIAWRGYDFSYENGVADDPLLLDRMTGPHGLKQVPDEFLDPRVCDPEPPAGAAYYFWSTVVVPAGEVTVTAGARAPYRLWVDDDVVLDQPVEVPAHRTPAWHLRDLSVVNQTRVLPSSPGRARVLLRLTVSGAQPTRASVAVGGTAAVERSLTRRPPRARLRWWHGDHPCLRFDPQPDRPAETVWVRAVSPPGLRAVELTTHGILRSARLGSTGQQLSISTDDPAHDQAQEPTGGPTSVRLETPELVPETDQLLLEVEATTPGFSGAAVLGGPLRWVLGGELSGFSERTATSPTAAFLELGLADFSGLVRLRHQFDWRLDDEPVLASLPGLAETAKITVNGRVAGTVIADHQELDITRLVRDGTNEIEVEVANTVLNRFSVLPSPYSHMQQPGGGFTAVRLVRCPTENEVR